MFDYFTVNNLFCIEQFGFRPGYSTELAALKVVDHLTKQVDQMHIPINIYIDLSKAFDTLDHSILVSKLDYYGITNHEKDLFINYLSERYQYVEYNGSKSSHQPISTGVPQGSILGPLLFLIYINDLPVASNLFNMLMYADDTTLYCNIDQHTNEYTINAELNKIKEWLSSNKLSLNISKTKCMVFHSKQRIVQYPKLKIDNNIIEQVSKFNFLGLILNSHLTWQNHIDHISNKVSRVIGIMYRLKHIYPQLVLQMLYNSLIVPYFTYCLLVWGSKVCDGYKLHLHLVQKRALRLIASQDYIAHSESINE